MAVYGVWGEYPDAGDVVSLQDDCELLWIPVGAS